MEKWLQILLEVDHDFYFQLCENITNISYTYDVISTVTTSKGALGPPQEKKAQPSQSQTVAEALARVTESLLKLPEEG